MDRFAISDEHYFNQGIITHCGRPFDSVEQMNERMIENNNRVVKPNDEVYHIGDFTYSDASIERVRYLLSRLKGRHHLILGNHDHLNPFDYVEAGFISVHTAFWIEGLVMVHDPSVYTFCKRELGILVHGHVHDLYFRIPDKPVLNVSVEMVDYTPISFQAIKNLFKP